MIKINLFFCLCSWKTLILRSSRCVSLLWTPWWSERLKNCGSATRLKGNPFLMPWMRRNAGSRTSNQLHRCWSFKAGWPDLMSPPVFNLCTDASYSTLLLFVHLKKVLVDTKSRHKSRFFFCWCSLEFNGHMLKYEFIPNRANWVSPSQYYEV